MRPIDYGTPPIGAISVSGTTVFSGGPDHARSLAGFREWLVLRHPGAKVTVRCRWRPEEYGRAKIKITPAEPLGTRSGVGSIAEQQRLLWIEQSEIEDVWRQMVGWDS